MGLFDEILGAITGAAEELGGATVEEAERIKELVAPIKKLVAPSDTFPGGFQEARALAKEQRAPGEEPDVDDMLAALLRGKTEDFLALARSAKTTEDLLALDQARVELVQLGTDLPALREKVGLLEALPEFTEDTTAEEIISALSDVLPKLAIEAEGEAVALTPEDQAFADLQARSMELDVGLKEQQLASAQATNQQAGMMNLLNMLPASARASTIATIMETPTLREQLFPGLFGGGGAGAAVGGSAEGDVFSILTQLGGGE